MGNKIKILYLTNRLSPAGAETFLLNHMRWINRERFEPIVAEMASGGELGPRFEAIGIRSISFMQKHRLDWQGIYRLVEFLRSERVAILEAHVWYSCLVARLAGKLAGVSIIITNEQDVRIGLHPMRRSVRWLEDVTTKMSDACVYITRAVEVSFVTGTPTFLQGRKVTRRVIPNGIDCSVIDAAIARTNVLEKRRSLGLDENAFLIGNVGRLQPAKGHSYLIEAFGQLQHELPDPYLIIVGWGVQREELEAHARELGVEQRVRFLGKRLDVYELLPCFDVFAFSSIHEPQGIAILEAMAAHLPVVATEVDGIPEMVRHEKTGLLVPPASAKDLAEGVLRLHRDQALAERLTRNARRLVENDYSIQHSTKEYAILYEELINSYL